MYLILVCENNITVYIIQSLLTVCIWTCKTVVHYNNILLYLSTYTC